MTQGEALDILKLGKNVFLTGAAGSGKTYLLNQYIDHLRAHGVGVAITASTGIAATHIGGQTIHSWSGMGIRDSLADDEIQKLAQKSTIKRNFKNTKVLVIDEVSMLHAHQLDMVERIARHMLDFTQPFGGLQVVLVGDFFQLPPVAPDREVKFAYECAAWNSGEFQICYLREQFRQGEDDLLEVLNHIREGRAGEETKVPLRRAYKRAFDDYIYPTKLYARNVNVDKINEGELEKLEGEEKVFQMETRGFKKMVESLRKSCLAPEELRLKEGAEVMFVKNAVDGSYVNGTRGVVEGFDRDEGWPLVRTFDGELLLAEPAEWRYEEDGAVRASVTQVPLRLAWAITIHKSQGMTLDAAEIDLSDAFLPGMGYVALSRVRALSGLRLMGLNDTALAVHPKILAADKKFREWSEAVREIIAAFSDEEKEKKHKEIMEERFEGRRGKSVGEKVATHDVTRAMIEEGKSLEEVAEERGVKVGTVIDHLEKLKGFGRLPDITHLKPAKKDFQKMKAALERTPEHYLGPAYKSLGGNYSYDDLKVTRLFLSRVT